MKNKACSKCGEVGMKFKGTDAYCISCRRAVNAKRSTPEARKARSDSYYWNVHIPQLQARLNAKYPMPKKIGVYYEADKRLLDRTESDVPIHNRLSWEGYKRGGDGE
jgi:uncharacterized Zn finger protein (UPF0148 family)